MKFRTAIDKASTRYREAGRGALRRWGAIVAATALALGALSAAAQTTPLTGANFVAAGGSHACVVLPGGAAKCWGNNFSGQVGDNSTTDRTTPVPVVGLASGVTAIAVGGSHTCALVSGGVKCWGTNGNGQLGDSSNTPRLTPVDVTGLGSGVTAIAAGGAHTCALTTGGGVKCWGLNNSGQLGDNSTTLRTAPVDVVGLTSGVTSVAVGVEHTCAVKSGGAVQCWGNNFVGTLGNNSIDDSHVPVDVSGLGSGGLTVAVGISHSCALMSAGGVKCWGINFNGQLGDGTMIDIRRTPVDVVGLTGATALSSFGNFACVRTGAGGMKCWGSNDSGELGNDSTTQSHVPVDVNGLTAGVAQIATGDSHACARLNSTGVMCWGNNVNGQLGDMTKDESHVPVDVVIPTPPGAPGAPTIGTATAGFLQATATFTPGSNGGSPITGFTVLSSPGGGVDSNAGTTGTSHTITGLSPCIAYTFTVTATNVNGTGPPSASSNSVTPIGPGIAVSPASIPNGTVGVVYPTQNLSASGCPGPFTFAVTANMLPAGLQLTAQGVLAGTPTVVGPFNFTVTATDSTSNGSGGPFTATKVYTGSIINPGLLDIDINGQYGAETDGLIVIRYLFGLRDAPMTFAAIGAGATRSDPEDILDHLASIDLDIDDNGTSDALTDGVLIVRYMQGLRGAALVNGALGDNPGRNTQQIEAYLQSLMP